MIRIKKCKRIAAMAAMACLFSSGITMGYVVSAAPAMPATPLISRDVPAYASDGQAQAANDANYRTCWRGAAPGWLAYDLSKVPAKDKGKAILVWYSDSYDYDPTIKHRLSYGNLTSYTIEINKAAGGTLPEKGWQVVADVKDNVYHSRQHEIDLTGANWVRINVAAVDNAGGNNASINVDIHNVKNGAYDDWIVYGDSITAGSGNLSGSPYGPAGQIVNAANENYYPIFECGGTGSIKSKDGAKKIDEWLSIFPGHYVGIALGTNDSWGQANGMEKYYKNMEIMVQKILAAGKVPVVATIPWSSEPGVADNAPNYNAKLEELYKAYPAIVKGPDFWNIFMGHKEWLSPDGVHPSPAGYGIMRAEWAKTMLAEKRKGKSAQITPELAKAAWLKKASDNADSGQLTKGEQEEIRLQKEKHAKDNN